MSVLASTWAWQQQITPNLKLMLVALADHAHDDGRGAWPSVELLSAKTGYSERQVTRNLKDLVTAGVIRIERQATRHRPTEYALNISESFVVLRGDKMSPLPEVTSEPVGVTSEADLMSQMSPEPSVEPSGEPSTTTTPADAAAGGVKFLKPHAYDHPPAVCCLVARWYDGWNSTHPDERPDPSVAKRVAGHAKAVAKDRKTHEDWVRAAAAAFAAGEQGIYDIVQGIPVQRRSQFVSDRVAEERVMFAVSDEVLARRAARDAEILAQRAADGR